MIERGLRRGTVSARAGILVATAAVALLVALTASPALAPPAAAAPTDADQRFAQIVLDDLSPSIVTSSSGPELTIRGSVRNTSDRELASLSIRLERGEPVRTSDGLRTSLTVEHPPIAASTDFAALTDTLGPGQTTDIDMTVPLAGPGGLNLSQTGVYPLQLNVNGVPDYGAMAQVAGSRLLLPVLSLPPDSARADQFVDPSDGGAGAPAIPGLGPDGSVSPDLATPSQFTMLWPVAAPPQVASGTLGDSTDPVRLTSDALPMSMRPDGRLSDLLAGLRRLLGESDGSGPNGAGPDGEQPAGVEPDGPAPAEQGVAADVQRSLCVAVDPDLLETAQAITQRGYVVTTNPSDPTAETVGGDGSESVANWLSELRDIASQMCVVALPFAQADLASLSQVGSSGLIREALDSPADTVDAILGVSSVRGMAIPSGATFNGSAAVALRDSSMSSAVVPTTAVDPTGSPDPFGAYRVNDLAVQTSDGSVTAALASLGEHPSLPALTPVDQQLNLDAESSLSRRQTAMASLAFRSIETGRESADTSGDQSSGDQGRRPIGGRGQLIVPPAYWGPSSDDAGSLLNTMSLLLGAQVATPTPLSELVAGLADADTPATIADPVTDESAATPVDAETAEQIRELASLSWQLQGALVSSADAGVTPDTYVHPLREDLLRALRATPSQGAATTAALLRQRDQRMNAVSATLATMRQGVTILDPGGRYTLASERSPLLLVVRNDLALPMRVQITSSGATDLNVGDIGAMEIPPRGTRQIQLPTQAESSEATTVTISMDAVTGLRLGTPITMSVHANAYGGALFIITICAGVVLVGLTARRLWHRFRGEPDRADEDRPEPDEVERVLAASSYQQRRRNLQNEGADELPYHRSTPPPRMAERPAPTAGGPKHAARRAGQQRAPQQRPAQEPDSREWGSGKSARDIDDGERDSD